jgi:hypothetical protein
MRVVIADLFFLAFSGGGGNYQLNQSLSTFELGLKKSRRRIWQKNPAQFCKLELDLRFQKCIIRNWRGPNLGLQTNSSIIFFSILVALLNIIQIYVGSSWSVRKRLSKSRYCLVALQRAPTNSFSFYNWAEISTLHPLWASCLLFTLNLAQNLFYNSFKSNKS